LDTTSNEAFKALAQEPLSTAIAAFAKAEEMSKGKGYFVTDAMGLPILKDQQMATLGNYYLNKGANAYQEEDFELAVAGFKKTQAVLPTDTTTFFYAGYALYQLEKFEEAITEFNGYLTNGGTSADAYSLIINLYNGPLEKKEEALAWVTKAKAKYPSNTDFPKVEIGILIDLNRIDAAKSGLEAAVAKEPENKILHFYLGYVNSKLEKWEESKLNYNAALKVDPEYFDAQYYLAQIYLIDAEKVKREMNNLGISKEDQKRKLELDKLLVEKYKIALPFWEKAEKMKTEDKNQQIEVLDRMIMMYYFLGEDAKAAAFEKKEKLLGVDDH
jgi:Tfp pilus assembly protein PilF